MARTLNRDVNKSDNFIQIWWTDLDKEKNLFEPHDKKNNAWMDFCQIWNIPVGIIRGVLSQFEFP